MKSFTIKQDHKGLLVSVIGLYLTVTALVGSVRYLSHHAKVLSSVIYAFAPGYGYQNVEYFNKLVLIVPIEPFNLMDLFTAEFMILAGLTAAFSYYALKKTPLKTNYRKLYLCFAFGFVFLGADELFTLHEFIGLNLANVLYPNLKGLALLDKDFNGRIVVGYAIIALAVLMLNLRFFKSSRAAWRVLAVGFLFHAASAAIDFLQEREKIFSSIKAIFGPFKFLLQHDEFYELTAAFLYMIAIALYSIRTLSRYYAYENGSFILKKADV